MRLPGLLILPLALFGNPAFSQPTMPVVPEAPETPDYVAARAARLNTAWADLNRRLEKSVSLSLINVSLSQAAREVAQQIDAPLRIDEIALEDADISPQMPVTIQLDRQAAEEAFRQLEAHGVIVTIDGTSLVLTTQAAVADMLFIRVYPVSDLVPYETDAKLVIEDWRLIDVIQQTTSPWFDVDGVGGTVRALSVTGVHALVVWQSARVHREIERLLHELRVAAKTRPAGRPPTIERRSVPAPPTVTSSARIVAPETPAYVVARAKRAEKAWADINSKLNKPVWIDVKNVSRQKVLERIARQIGVTLTFDEDVLRVSPVRLSEEISLVIEGQSAEAAIKAAGKSQLVIAGTGDLLFVTGLKGEAFNRLTTRVYPIGDLVIRGVSPDGAPFVDYTSFASLIENVTRPWLEVDGFGGTYRWLSQNGIDVLVVRQSILVHREIEKLLDDLRKAPKSKLPASTPAPTESRPDEDSRLDDETSTDGVRFDSSSSNSQLDDTIVSAPSNETLAANVVYRHSMSGVVVDIFDETPLRQVIDSLLKPTGLPLEYDDQAIEKANIDLNEPITANFENQTRGEAVQELLQQLGLGLIWTGDKLIVTTGQIRSTSMVERYYRVEDLTWAIAPGRRLTYDALWLNEVILNTTSGPWAELEINETGGSVCEFQQGGTHFLSVRQTEPVHEEIDDLLYRIRKAKTNDREKYR